MRRIAGLYVLLLLGACARPETYAEPVMEAGAVIEQPSVSPAPACTPAGEGDGIGGTGCATD